MGFIYSHGRDKKFRPTIILDSSVFEALRKQKPELFNVDTICTACQFLMQYIKKHMFLPGRIEHWVVINNLNKLSFGKLPKNEMKKAFDMLQNNYMYVLGKTWGVNCTAMQNFLWKVFEVFLDRETAEKMSFHQTNAPDSLVNNFHPSQLEKRFGGQAETPKIFWPPVIPTQQFRFEEDQEKDLVSWEENEKIIEEHPLLPKPPADLL